MWRSFTPLNSSLSLSLTWHLISSSQLCLFTFSSYLLTWQSFPHTETIEHTWRHRTTLGNTIKVFGKMSSTRAVHFLFQCLLALALHYCAFYSATATPIDSLLGTHRVKGSVLPTARLSRLPSLSMITPWSLHFATKTMIYGSADLYFFCVFPCIKHCRMQTWNSLEISSEIELSPMLSNTWDYIPSGSTSNIIFCSIPLGKGIF